MKISVFIYAEIQLGLDQEISSSIGYPTFELERVVTARSLLILAGSTPGQPGVLTVKGELVLCFLRALLQSAGKQVEPAPVERGKERMLSARGAVRTSAQTEYVEDEYLSSAV